MGKGALNNENADLDLEEIHLGPNLAVDYGARHACLAQLATFPTYFPVPLL